MKKISILFVSFVLVLFNSCIGDLGPQGPAGFDGLDGEIGSIFEVNVDFTEAGDYAWLEDFPANIVVFDTDIVVAYVLTDVDNGVDIWEPLPRTLFFDNGILLYGYDHTFSNINFFLDGTINLATLSTDFTDNVIFRVAILPADFASSINTSDINEVMNAMNVDSVERVY